MQFVCKNRVNICVIIYNLNINYKFVFFLRDIQFKLSILVIVGEKDKNKERKGMQNYSYTLVG